MIRAYRFGRGFLAVAALITAVAFAGWHVLVWRMGCVYRREVEIARAGTRAGRGPRTDVI